MLRASRARSGRKQQQARASLTRRLDRPSDRVPMTCGWTMHPLYIFVRLRVLRGGFFTTKGPKNAKPKDPWGRTGTARPTCAASSPAGPSSAAGPLYYNPATSCFSRKRFGTADERRSTQIWRSLCSILSAFISVHLRFHLSLVAADGRAGLSAQSADRLEFRLFDFLTF
jgi:hypothetical protein